MPLAEIIRADGIQTVKLPEGYHFTADAVSIRREGEKDLGSLLFPESYSFVAKLKRPGTQEYEATGINGNGVKIGGAGFGKLPKYSELLSANSLMLRPEAVHSFSGTVVGAGVGWEPVYIL